ncbi:MAG TPA: hypothetical protein PK646_06130 [Bacillota bacterium]|jgi:hypothetical protein|nr:hypothetical protein [Fastidiosipila sp.]HPX93821.1 hypothetical protein [Bacillota bacterium]HQB81646.1 hypothetical protein [Bacillota bacterium]
MRGNNITCRSVILVLAVATIALAVAGCGGKTSPTVEPTISQAEFRWPSSEIAGMLPVPESTVGTLEWETAAGMLVRMRNTSKEQYDAYVDACREWGFVNDYARSDESYSAYNEAGYFLTLEYRKNAMSIEIEAPAEAKEPDRTEEATVVETTAPPTTAQETPAETTKADDPVSGIRPEFKKAMDSYEEFMDEYVAFMIKYKGSTDQLGMLTEYSSYLVKYADAMEKLDELDDEEWSTAETLYFTEVMTRVNEKLATIP